MSPNTLLSSANLQLVKGRAMFLSKGYILTSILHHMHPDTSKSSRMFLEDNVDLYKVVQIWPGRSCVNKSQFAPVIFEPPCTFLEVGYTASYSSNNHMWETSQIKKRGPKLFHHTRKFLSHTEVLTRRALEKAFFKFTLKVREYQLTFPSVRYQFAI